MSALILPKRYHPDFRVPNRKPVGSVEIDRNAPQTRGIIGALINAGNSVVDVTDGKVYHATIGGNFVSGSDQNGVWVGSTTPHADEIRLGSSISSGGINEKWASPQNQFTVLTVIKRTGTASGNAPIFGSSSPNTAPYSSWALANRGGGTLLRLEASPGGAYKSVEAAVLDVDKYVVGVGVYDGSSLKLYANGVLVASTAASGNLTYSSTSNWGPAIGNFFDYTGSTSFIGQIYMCAVWDRAVPDPARLSTDPYQIFKPRNPITYFIPSAGGGGATDNLLADDVQSTSELTSPAIGQTHALNAADTQSTSETSTPAIGQVQALLASDTESASEVTNPAIQVVTPLLADDVQSTSEVSAPQIGQIHALTANPVESASQTGLPAVGQVHVLAANDIESTSQTDLPVIGQAHVLAANDVESASELSTPALTELIDVDALFAEDIQAASEVTTPSFGQTHGLAANDIQSISQLTYPTLGIVGLQQPGDFTLMRRRGRR